ncbi:hypothetical protein BGW42_007820 [Actinomortierella wolfii]|nr:hypothetical protein BGW42_007820 [Actinomortierella wolfii]
MPLISSVPHGPTLHFYRRALRILRVNPQLVTHSSASDKLDSNSSSKNNRGQLLPQMGHLQRKLRANVRDGIRIYQDVRDATEIDQLIRDGEQDLEIIKAWQHVDRIWVERIFKPPTAAKKSKQKDHHHHLPRQQQQQQREQRQ